MPARSTRRRRHKQLDRLRTLSDGQRRVIAVWHLKRWRREAIRRARDLGAPAAWALAAEVAPQARALDPDGSLELAADLARACAEAVAAAAGRHLIAGSRPSADRDRRRPLT